MATIGILSRYQGSIKKGISVLVISLISSITAAAVDDYVVSTWETDQGLPENSATSMVQDKDGFLWFGTFNGLVRFDGINFEIFDRSNLPILPSPGIVNLHLDREQRLWVSTVEGLIIKEGKMWKHYDDTDGWEGNFVRDFAEAEDGTIYVTTFDGKILVFDDNQFSALPSPPGAQSEGIFIRVASDGILWALDSEFYGYWQAGTWHTVQSVHSAFDFQENYAMAPSTNGNAWIIDGNFLWRFEGAEQIEKVRLPKGCGNTWGLYEDSNEKIWIASFKDGLSVYDRRNGKWTLYTSDNLLTHNSLRFVFEDVEGHHWVGSSGGGLMQFQEPRFTSFGKQHGLSEPLVKSVSVDQHGDVFAATFGGGVNVLSNQRFTVLPADIPKTIYGQSVLVDQYQQVWAGMSGRGLFLGSARENLLKSQTDIAIFDIRASFEDSSGDLWFGARNIVYQRRVDDWIPRNLPNGLKSSITSIAQQPESGEIYVGTSTAGVFRVDGKSLKRAPINERFDQESVSSLLFLSRDELLIGTFDLGLVVQANNSVTHLNQSRGFPGSGISSTTRNGEQIWIGTNKGIVRMEIAHLRKMLRDPSQNFLGQVFTQSDGLSSIECPIGFQPTASQDANGRIWFASGKGLNVIEPERLQINTVDLSVAFDQLSFTDNDRTRRHFTRPDSESPLLIPPDHSNVMIRFTSPSFASPEKIIFETILESPDQRIVNRQSDREIQFHRLAPGTYHLTVRARNGDGIWSDNPGHLELHVSPFYWQTAGFQFGVGSVVVFLTGGIGFWISRRQMGREMRFIKSEHRLKNLLEQTQQSAEIGGWEYDTESNSLYWTKEAFSIHESSPSQINLDLEQFYQFYIESDQTRLRDAIQNATERTESFDIEVQQARTGVYLRVTGKVVETPSRKIFGCFQNIQAQKDREQRERDQESQLRQSQKLEAIGTLAGGIAHDFNNILTGIQGYTDLLGLDLSKQDPAQEHVRELKDAAGRATDLVKQILTYSRPSSEKLRPLNPVDISNHALRLIRASIPSSIEIQTALSIDVPIIPGSDTQIHQLLVNLFTNAAHSIGDLGVIKYTLESETITDYRAHPLGDLEPGLFVVFEVQDSGKGMSQEIVDRIFDPFFTTRSDSGGTGLGLSVVLGIVKSHRGAIRIRTSEGKGTSFRVYFPSISSPTEIVPETQGPVSLGSGQRVLLIDDDPDVMKVSTRMMRQLGYTPECFLSPVAAVAAFDKTPTAFSLIITDLTMPVMRGDAVIARIRRKNLQVPIILMSGNLEDKNPNTLDPGGRLQWLQKPFLYEELARSVSMALNDPSEQDLANSVHD